MDFEFPWGFLNIEATADKREIKRAYARLIKTCRPDDDPEGFQRLREAYEMAMSLTDILVQTRMVTSDTSLPVASGGAIDEPGSGTEMAIGLFERFVIQARSIGLHDAANHLIEATSGDDFWADPLIYDQLQYRLVPFLADMNQWIREPIERLSEHFSWPTRLLQLADQIGFDVIGHFLGRIESYQYVDLRVKFNRIWRGFVDKQTSLPDHLAINWLVEQLKPFDEEASVALIKEMIVSKMTETYMTPSILLMLFERFDLNRELTLSNNGVNEETLTKLEIKLMSAVDQLKKPESVSELEFLAPELGRVISFVVVMFLVMVVPRLLQSNSIPSRSQLTQRHELIREWGPNSDPFPTTIVGCKRRR